MDYYNAINYDLLLRHLVNARDIRKKQIAWEDKDLMTIAPRPTDLRQDKELRKIYNWEENLKNVFYGEGHEDGRIDGRSDRNIEIAIFL